jgi:hypothetical protein
VWMGGVMWELGGGGSYVCVCGWAYVCVRGGWSDCRVVGGAVGDLVGGWGCARVYVAGGVSSCISLLEVWCCCVCVLLAPPWQGRMLLPIPGRVSGHATFQAVFGKRAPALCMVAASAQRRLHIRIEAPPPTPDELTGATRYQGGKSFHCVLGWLFLST